MTKAQSRVESFAIHTFLYGRLSTCRVLSIHRIDATPRRAAPRRLSHAETQKVNTSLRQYVVPVFCYQFEQLCFLLRSVDFIFDIFGKKFSPIVPYYNSFFFPTYVPATYGKSNDSTRYLILVEHSYQKTRSNAMTTPNITPQKLSITATPALTNAAQQQPQSESLYRESQIEPGKCCWIRIWRLCRLLLHSYV